MQEAISLCDANNNDDNHYDTDDNNFFLTQRLSGIFFFLDFIYFSIQAVAKSLLF